MVLKAALVGALALVAVGTTVVSAQEFGEPGQRTARSVPTLTEGHIASLRSSLNLTAEQARHWPAVEAALRAVAHSQARAEASGLVGRISSTASSVRRLIAVSRPLVRSLDPEQKSHALRLARSMGFASVAAAF